jgi:hypothetical protein
MDLDLFDIWATLLVAAFAIFGNATLIAMLIAYSVNHLSANGCLVKR